MLRLLVIGAAGRMGRRVVAISESLEDVEVVGAVIRSDDPRVGDDAGLVAGTNVIGVPLLADLPDCEADAVIDFSSPAGTRRFVPLAAERGLPLVIATTGLDVEARASIVEASKRVAVMFAPNLSIGVALLSRLAAETARALGLEADVEIVETHHRGKKDAPSGTALHLASVIAAARGRDGDSDLVYGRRAAPGEVGQDRASAEIAIHALRAGDVVGEHTLTFAFGSERLELTHRAHSRDIFARGAIRAAHFIAKAPPGLYGLEAIVGRPDQGVPTGPR